MKTYAKCAECGQRGDRPPGLRLSEVGPDAIFVGDQLALLAPKWLECRACGHKEMVDGSAITVEPRPQP